MADNLSGGTTNLLRMARSGCQSAVAFVAFALGDETFATATYPSALGDGLPSSEEVEDLVGQLWLEPGLAQGKALVRTVRLGGLLPGQAQTRFAVAAVPLGAGEGDQPWGILGVADPGAKCFGLPALELLSRIAQRLTSYVIARQKIRTQLAATAARREEPWPEPTSSSAAATASAAPPTGWPQFTSPPPFAPPSPTSSPPASPPASPPQAADERPEPASELGSVIGGHAVPGAGQEQPEVGTPAGEDPGAVDPLGVLLGGDSVPGLLPLGALLSRAGRLLGAGATASGSLAVIVVTVEGVPHEGTGVVADLVRALRADLRFDDPLARIDGLSFVAVVPLAPGGTGPEQVEARLADRAREALVPHPSAVVRAAHVVAPLSAGSDADELLRSAAVKIRAA